MRQAPWGAPAHYGFMIMGHFCYPINSMSKRISKTYGREGRSGITVWDPGCGRQVGPPNSESAALQCLAVVFIGIKRQNKAVCELLMV